VKSPVASLCFVCSSVRNLVRVTMSMLTFSACTGGISPFVPFVAILSNYDGSLEVRLYRINSNWSCWYLGAKKLGDMRD